MYADLRDFLARYTGTVVMTVVPVALIANLSLPVSLGRRPCGLPPDADVPRPNVT